MLKTSEERQQEKTLRENFEKSWENLSASSKEVNPPINKTAVVKLEPTGWILVTRNTLKLGFFAGVGCGFSPFGRRCGPGAVFQMHARLYEFAGI